VSAGGSAGGATGPAVPRRGRTRWALLGSVLLLAGLAGITSALDATAPRADRSAPAVADLEPTVLEAPIPCRRSDPDEVVAAIADRLRPGRVTAAIVVACPRLFDGREVVHVGEVVGDVLRRDGGAWVTLNDDPYALELGPFGAHRERAGFNTGLAVHLPEGTHEDLGPAGRYGRRGAVLRVEGVLERADAADGGGLTIRARTVEVLAPAVDAPVPVDPTLAVAAAITAATAVVALLHARRRRRT
jgi:hypothetical protein